MQLQSRASERVCIHTADTVKPIRGSWNPKSQILYTCHCCKGHKYRTSAHRRHSEKRISSMHVVHLPQLDGRVAPEPESKQLAKLMPEPTPKPMPKQMPQPTLDPVVKTDEVTASFFDESAKTEELVSKYQRAFSLLEALLLAQGKIAT